MTSLDVDRDQIACFVSAMFKHASDGQKISVRSFIEGTQKTDTIESVAINGGGLDPVVQKAIEVAQACANKPAPIVFAPPLAGFSPDAPEDHWRARKIDLREGYAISVELDEHPQRARR